MPQACGLWPDTLADEDQRGEEGRLGHHPGTPTLRDLSRHRVSCGDSIRAKVAPCQGGVSDGSRETIWVARFMESSGAFMQPQTLLW